MENVDLSTRSDRLEDPAAIHQCTSFRLGDWIVYRCGSCSYELRENWRTGELLVKNSTPAIRHFGGYYPQEYKEAFENLS